MARRETTENQQVKKGIPIEECPDGWVYCEGCNSAFTVARSLDADPSDDCCPVCGNDELVYYI
jgi:hypothetical protein